VLENEVASYLQQAAKPKIVRIHERLFAAVFETMKLGPALYIIDNAIREGLIDKETTVVETTSGTFGLGLAMVCAVRGINLHLVSDPAIDRALMNRLNDLGTTVTIVEKPSPISGYQGARLEELDRLLKSFPKTYCPSQYSNLNNPASYGSLASQIIEAVGDVEVLVGAVGSGGSMCGTTKALRTLNSEMLAVGVDTHRSVLFGQQEGPRLLRGLGNSILPTNLDHAVFDEVQWVSAALAFKTTRGLHKEFGIFAGPTSGAAYLAAADVAARTEGNVVVIMPDSGHRYLSTVYDDDWLENTQGAIHESALNSPVWVSTPHAAKSEWNAMKWQRRSLQEASE
jgi:cysteine synthase